MSSFEPDDHRVVVAFSDEMLVGPLVFLGFIHSIGFASFEWVGIIAELEPIVIVPSKLFDAEQTSIWKGFNIGLISLFIHKLMIVLNHIVLFKVHDCYFVVTSLQHNCLSIVHHREGIDIVIKEALI